MILHANIYPVNESGTKKYCIHKSFKFNNEIEKENVRKSLLLNMLDQFKMNGKIYLDILIDRTPYESYINTFVIINSHYDYEDYYFISDAKNGLYGLKSLKELTKIILK